MLTAGAESSALACAGGGFVDFSRGVVLKGAGLPELWPSVLLLFAYTAIIFALAVWRFRKKVV